MSEYRNLAGRNSSVLPDKSSGLNHGMLFNMSSIQDGSTSTNVGLVFDSAAMQNSTVTNSDIVSNESRQNLAA